MVDRLLVFIRVATGRGTHLIASQHVTVHVAATVEAFIDATAFVGVIIFLVALDAIALNVSVDTEDGGATDQTIFMIPKHRKLLLNDTRPFVLLTKI
jgi:hypothetical protein